MSNEKNQRKSGIDSEWIRELASILNETGLTEIEVENDDVRLRVSRSAPPAPQAVFAAPAHPPAPAAIAAPEAKSEPARRTGAVPSPMVGTAYLSPSPGSAPFVSKGDRVVEGQTLMIIEAMKTMNPISAPRAGVVAEIIVTDAQPVEYGEPLIVIE